MVWEASSLSSAREAGAVTTADERGRGRLTVVYPSTLAFVVDLSEERTVLGRQPADTNSPPLVEGTVSRGHFAVEWDSSLGTHVGQDLGSRNGSWIDGAPIKDEWHPLWPSSVLRIGEVLMVYESEHTFAEPEGKSVSQDAIFGNAIDVRHLRAQMERASPDLSPALLLGETGTGKEWVAREIHRLSGRTGDFVPVNCAALGEHLIESQLFGHVKGAFTGATGDQPGLFKAAEGGTLFLDEIGEMPLALQPKLLRAIQEREVRAVGSTQNASVDVRVLAATHQDLKKRVGEGAFRQDLYARLALWEILIPPLRHRRVDMLSWIHRFHELWQKERNIESKPFVFNAVCAEFLTLANWPENLRGINRLVHELGSHQNLPTPIRPRNLPSWLRRPTRAAAARAPK